MNELVTIKKIEQAKLAIREVKTLEEIKQIVDQSEALKAYVKSAKLSQEMQADAAELNIRATRRLGEISRMLESKKGGDRRSINVRSTDIENTKTATLENIGITRQRASEAEKLAAIPEQEFEFKLSEAKKAADKITKSLFIVDPDDLKAKQHEATVAQKRAAKYVITGKKPEGWIDGEDDKLAEEFIASQKRLEAYYAKLEEQEEENEKQYPFYPVLMKYLNSIKNPEKKKEACQNIIKTCKEVLNGQTV